MNTLKNLVATTLIPPSENNLPTLNNQNQILTIVNSIIFFCLSLSALILWILIVTLAIRWFILKRKGLETENIKSKVLACIALLFVLYGFYLIISIIINFFFINQHYNF